MTHTQLSGLDAAFGFETRALLHTQTHAAAHSRVTQQPSKTLSLCTKSNVNPLCGTEGWHGAWCQQCLGAPPCFPLVLLPSSLANVQRAGMAAAVLHASIGPHGGYCGGDCLKLVLTTYIPKYPSYQDPYDLPSVLGSHEKGKLQEQLTDKT